MSVLTHMNYNSHSIHTPIIIKGGINMKQTITNIKDNLGQNIMTLGMILLAVILGTLISQETIFIFEYWVKLVGVSLIVFFIGFFIKNK